LTKRKVGSFDPVKYTTYFIIAKLLNLTGKSDKDVEREGFDPYAYLMAYEKDILVMYKDSKYRDLSKLQKAALHFIEVGLEVVELDYLKYVATYDDVVVGAISTNGDNQAWSVYIPVYGKLHYESGGKLEILTGAREVVDFFDPVLYAATYPMAKSAILGTNGVVDNTKATVAYITVGAFNGFMKNGFVPMVFLANYPELVSEDIYTDGELCDRKIAKLWLEKFSADTTLDKFDVEDFKENNELKDDEDPYKVFVLLKVKEHKNNERYNNLPVVRLIKFVKGFLNKQESSKCLPLPAMPAMKRPEVSCFPKFGKKVEKNQV
jgi:hypothetical protein